MFGFDKNASSKREKFCAQGKAEGWLRGGGDRGSMHENYQKPKIVSQREWVGAESANA